MEIHKIVAKVLKSELSILGLSVKDIANITGMQQSGLSRIFTGQQNMTIDLLERITEAMGLTVYEVVAKAEAIEERLKNSQNINIVKKSKNIKIKNTIKNKKK